MGRAWATAPRALSEPKVVIDAIEPLEHNLGVVMHHLRTQRVPRPGVDAEPSLSGVKRP